MSEKLIFLDFVPFSFFAARPPRADDSCNFFIILPPNRIGYNEDPAQAAFR
jgi:hypothetical protein